MRWIECALLLLSVASPGFAAPGGVEFCVTRFEPNVSINDQVSAGGQATHLFSIPKSDYLGLSVAFVRPGTLALRTCAGVGRQDLRVYAENPVTSRGAFLLKTYWLYVDIGTSWTLRRGSLETAPGIGTGSLVSVGDISHPQIPGGTTTQSAVAAIYLDLPVRVRLRERLGLSLAYHRILPIGEMRYDFGFGNPQVEVHLETPHELRLGVFLYR